MVSDLVWDPIVYSVYTSELHKRRQTESRKVTTTWIAVFIKFRFHQVQKVQKLLKVHQKNPTVFMRFETSWACAGHRDTTHKAG